MKNIMRFLIKIAAVAVAVWVTTMIVPGIQVTGGLKNYLVIALVLALINATLGTLLKILTLPLAFLSLGFSLLVVKYCDATYYGSNQ
jgi:putative membrane protein